MTTTALSTQLPTLLDQARARDPSGAIAMVVEALAKKNSLLEDMVVVPTNGDDSHVVTSRTALPSIAWRRYNEGVTPSKSTRGQVTETCGMVEGWSVVDCELADKNGDAPAYRASEDMAFVSKFQQEIELGAFYHSTQTNPERFQGLAPRFNSTTGPGGSQIVKCDASASGNDQTSIWLIAWGPKTVYGIFPKNSKAGLTPHDMGERPWDDGFGAGGKFRAYVTNWNWKMGFCVEDSRYISRICNVDTGNLVATDSSIITAMVMAYYKLFDTTTGRLAWYCNRTVGTYLHLQALNNVKTSTLTIENIGGQPVTHFLGIPVRVTDAITNTEATIS